MNQRIVVDNFGPIHHADIELKPLVLLIGQQAEGKSTLAKLVYFFRLIPVDFFANYYASDSAGIDLSRDLIFPIREKFYDFFGSTFHLPDFSIVFFYSEDRSLRLTLTPKKKINAHFSDDFFSTADRSELRGYKRTLMQVRDDLESVDTPAKRVLLDNRQDNALHQMSEKINDIFSTHFDDSLYIVAGRNATVGYSGTFEDMLRQSLRKNIQEQGVKAYEAKEQTVEETLMLAFMQRVLRMKQLFAKYGNFEGMIAMSANGKKGCLTEANRLVRKVVRGQYANSEYGERIVLDDGKYVYLKNASSGQQEAIRILQDAFLSIYQGNSVMRIVEEPEAHIYPVAQMYTIQLLVLMINSLAGSSLILTTHSPYTLTVINNLLYASKVGENHADRVGKIVSRNLWLKIENVAAYQLKGGVSESIIDEELGEIKAELIDEVSTVLNRQYDDLMALDYEKDNSTV